jgi:hypothetical protein
VTDASVSPAAQTMPQFDEPSQLSCLTTCKLVPRIAHSHFPGTSHSLDGYVNVWLLRLLNGGDGIGKTGNIRSRTRPGAQPIRNRLTDAIRPPASGRNTPARQAVRMTCALSFDERPSNRSAVGDPCDVQLGPVRPRIISASSNWSSTIPFKNNGRQVTHLCAMRFR